MGRTQRRDPGSGSIYYAPSQGLWVAALTLPPDPTTGKQRRKVMKGKTRQAVAKKLADAKLALAQSGDLASSTPTVQQWAKTWTATHIAHLKPRTQASYMQILTRYILPALGKKKVDKVTVAHIAQMEQSMIERGLSTTTTLNTHRVLAKMMEDAMRVGHTTRNVAKLMDAPPKAVSNRRALTVTEARTLMQHLSPDTVTGATFALALLGGLRRGELCGLTWDAVDLAGRAMVIDWQVQRLAYTHGCGGTCGRRRGGSCPQRTFSLPVGQEITQLDGALHQLRPKSRKGWRRAPISQALAAVLMRWQQVAPENRWGLVLSDGGRPLDPDDVTRWWAGVLLDAGLSHVPLHTARHTYNSLLAHAGMPVEQRQQILGHSSMEINLAYTHTDIEDLRTTVDAVGDMITLPQIEG